MTEKNIIIDWVRHAESCSNYDQGIVNDRIPEKYMSDCGYVAKKPILQEKKEPRSYGLTGLWSSTSAFAYEPNLSFIGAQHAIKLGTDYLFDKSYDYIFVSPMTRTIMTALFAFRRHPNVTIYVIPFISEHTNSAGYFGIDYQNTPVEITNLKKRVMYVKDWMEKSWLQFFDDIEVIEMLSDINNLLTGNVMYDYAKKVINDAFACKNQECNRNKINDNRKCTMITAIKYLADNVGMFNDDVQAKIKKLSQLLDPTIARGPTVDFSIYEQYTNLSSEETTKFDDFYGKIIHNHIWKQKPDYLTSDKYKHRILCVSHGSTMKSYFNEKYNAQINDISNTQVLQENIVLRKYDKSLVIYPGSINPIAYVPLSIRKSFQNFEHLNYDICENKSLRGVINNFMTTDYTKKYNDKFDTNAVPQDDKLLVSYLSSSLSKNIITPDNLFYYDQKMGDYIPDSNTLKGGYYDKYLKYKAKYLKLKATK